MIGGDQQKSKVLVMVNSHLGWSKFTWVGQRSLGLNGVHFDTFEAIVRN